MVDSCSKQKFCREDYICQVLPHQLKGVEQGKMLTEAGIDFAHPHILCFNYDWMVIRYQYSLFKFSICIQSTIVISSVVGCLYFDVEIEITPNISSLVI